MVPISKRINQVYYYFTALVGLKTDDILLVSFPKSGNTWIKAFFLNAIRLGDNLSEKLSFKFLDETMPEVGANNLLKPWRYKTLSRIIKTHSAYLPFFRNRRAIVIIRDPRDVMVSLYHYLQASKRAAYQGSFSEFLSHPKYGLEAWFIHTISWQDKATAVVKFEDIKTDGHKQMETVLEKLGIKLSSELIKEAFEESSFDKMKEMEKSGAKMDTEKFSGNFSFVRKGTTKQWVEYFKEMDLKLYDQILKRYSDKLDPAYQYR